MMRFLIALMAAIACPGAIRAEVEVPQPFHLMRALQALQNQIATGSAAAHAAQRDLVAQIAVAFGETAPELWADRRNAQAAAAFLFSGGPAQPIRRLVAANVFRLSDRPLVDGALAYVEGREGNARKALEPIEPLVEGGAIGGQLALVKSMLVRQRQPALSVRLLDEARLLSPGTLIEEAALRREIVIAGELGDIAMFARLATVYARRFARSIYAEAFQKRLGETATALALKEDALKGDGADAGWERLAEWLGSLRPELRASIAVALARAALAKGRLKLAERAAAIAAAGADRETAARTELYGAAARVIRQQTDADLATLSRVGSTLAPADRQIGQAARQVALGIRVWPVSEGAMPRDLHLETPLAIIAEGRKAIESANALLEASSR